MALGDAPNTGDGASGFLGGGAPSRDDLALGPALNRGRTTQPYAPSLTPLASHVDRALDLGDLVAATAASIAAASSAENDSRAF